MIDLVSHGAWPSGSVALRSRTPVAVHIRKGPKTWLHGGVARRCASDFRESPVQQQIQHGIAADQVHWLALQCTVRKWSGAPTVDQQTANELSTIDDPAEVGHVRGRDC